MALKKRNFPVKGMGCAACVARVQNTLKEQPGVVNVNVSLASNMAQVEYDSAVCSPEGLRKAVEGAGYELLIEGAEEESEDEAERAREAHYRALRRDVILALILSVLIAVIGMGVKDFPGKGYVLWALATPAVILCGRHFFVPAWKQLRHGGASMDTLVALSVSISYLFSVFNLLFPQVWTARGMEAHLYFESSAMIVAFILLGRVLEERAKHRTTSAIRALKALQPERTVFPGDIVEMVPGERIPGDGTVLSGASQIDESMLTGESEPVAKEAGSPVFAGTLNGRGTLTVRIDKAGKDTVLAGMIALVRDAQGSRAPVQDLVDRIARIFVPAVIGIALVTFLLWWLVGGQIVTGLLTMVTVLVIACPCSLGLATPTAIVCGIGSAARKGMLIRDAASLQAARRIDALVSDKTGTLTVGSPEVLAEGAAEAISALRSRGIDIHLISGDKPEAVQKVADALGITHAVSQVLPADKVTAVKQLQAAGHTVAMVGDGINDSAALATADLSIAMGRGTDVAMDAAQVTIVSSDLRKVPQLIDLSRRTVRIIRENLFWAFIYNILAIPLAAGVLYPWLLSPMVGAACMALSSVCVVGNSLRLLR